MELLQAFPSKIFQWETNNHELHAIKWYMFEDKQTEKKQVRWSSYHQQNREKLIYTLKKYISTMSWFESRQWSATINFKLHWLRTDDGEWQICTCSLKNNVYSRLTSQAVLKYACSKSKYSSSCICLSCNLSRIKMCESRGRDELC